MKAVTIAIANQKGGVGKTTTAVTLATGLAGLGHPTILVDCDSQGNVAQFLALESRPALYELVIQEKSPDIILQTIPNYPLLGIITGNQDTMEIEMSLNIGRRYDPPTAIKNALRPFLKNGRGRSTIIILDTAPSLSSIQISVLNASDWLIIPASPEYASETGIAALSQAVSDLQNAGSNLDLLGILPTLVDARSKEHKQTILDLRAAFSGLVLPPIRRRIAIAEAPRAGRPIWDYTPEASEDYALVLDRVVHQIGR